MQSVAVQLRARRAAADRCPPLACGHRDPLDPDHLDRCRGYGMTRNRPAVLWVTTDDARGLALLTGTVDVRTLLNRLGVPVRWSESGHGYMIPAHAIGDVLAYAETTGVVTRCRDRR